MENIKLKRLIMVLVCLSLSYFALKSSFYFILISLRELSIYSIFAITNIVAWASLFIMSIGWMLNKTVKRPIPALGIISGCISMLFPFPITLILSIPAVILAVIVVSFNEKKDVS